MCGDIKVATFPIVNGSTSPDPAVVNLSPSQQDAVAVLIVNDGRGNARRCTATVIAPSVVLTAAHCFFLMPTVGFLQLVIGDDSSPQGHEQYYEPDEYHIHPSYVHPSEHYDIAVVIVDEDLTARGITPIPVNLAPTSLVGKQIQAVGYGNTVGGLTTYNNRLRLWTTLTVERETATNYIAYGGGTTGVCDGDSGGPMLYTKPDGRAYVMGVVSAEEGEVCLGRAYYSRTDSSAARDFLRAFVPSEPGPVDPCEGETHSGRCEGNVAVWCEYDTIRREDCGAIGQVCGVDAQGNSRCVPATADPCQGETYQGRCDGDYAIWCEGDTVKMRDCAACNQRCGFVDDRWGYYCY